MFGKVEELVAKGWDPRQLLVQLLEEFRALFLAHRGVEDKGEVDPEHAERRGSLARTFTSAHLEWVLQALADAQADMRLSTHPRLTLEVALARASNLEVRETQTVVARLERLERVTAAGRRTRAGARPCAALPLLRVRSRPPWRLHRHLRRLPATPRAEPVARTCRRPAPTPAPRPLLRPLRSTVRCRSSGTRCSRRARSRSHVTHTHLRQGWPIELDGDRLVVGFEKDFHAERAHEQARAHPARHRRAGAGVRTQAAASRRRSARGERPERRLRTVELARGRCGRPRETRPRSRGRRGGQ